ncbi:carbamate kinase [Candidatus Woesearchaeota archaeon]|nr:carbamate kinase [Candidatus Woesearchaeota archaeon]
MRLVLALGGNAITQKGQKGTYKEIKKSIVKVCKILVNLAKQHQIVIVSGSGPQIGNLLTQNELTEKKIPPMPLDVLDAEFEGEIQYIIEQSLINELKKIKSNKKVVSLVTQTVVNKKDPGFKNPTKPIGMFYTEKEAQKLAKEGINIKEDAGRGWRRVVPSPKPIKIIEIKAIEELLKRNAIVIAAGGGGIPVYEERGKLKGIAAVIDKDLASACLAKEIKADLLLILTGVNKVALNYGKSNQKNLSTLTIREAKQYMQEGHFPEGSMGPKIEAAINFLKHGGKKVIITSPARVAKALKGKEGTSIT